MPIADDRGQPVTTSSDTCSSKERCPELRSTLRAGLPQAMPSSMEATANRLTPCRASALSRLHSAMTVGIGLDDGHDLTAVRR